MLEAALGEQPPGRVCDQLASALLLAQLGLHRALIDYVRDQALAGAPAARIRQGVRREAKRAIAQLEHGLRDLGARDAPA